MQTYTYPASDLDDIGKLLSSLGSFWVRTYEAKDQLNTYGYGNAQISAQTQLNILEAVAALSRHDVPVFHSENWYPLVLRKSEMNVTPANYYKFDEDNIYFDRDLQIQFDSLTKRDFFAFNVSPEFAGGGNIYDRVLFPSIALTGGIDFIVDRRNSALLFSVDPFSFDTVLRQPVYDGDKLVDEEITLWVFKAKFDYQYVFKQFAYVVNIRARSSENYKRLSNAIINGLLDGGASDRAIDEALSAILDVPLAKSLETVELITTDSRGTIIATDKNVYRFPADATPIVAVGDTVKPGQQLTNAFSIIELNRGLVPDELTAIALDRGFTFGCFYGDLIFENKEVPIIVDEAHPSGFTYVSFGVGGFPNDVHKFFDEMHARGIEDFLAGQDDQCANRGRRRGTLAHLLDRRVNPDSEPRAENLPHTINPLKFLVENILRNNAAVVLIKVAEMGSQHLGLHHIRHLRQLIPPQSALFFVYVIENIRNSIDGVTEIEEWPQIFKAAEPLTDTIDKTLIADRGATIKVVGGVCQRTKPNFPAYACVIVKPVSSSSSRSSSSRRSSSSSRSSSSRRSSSSSRFSSSSLSSSSAQFSSSSSSSSSVFQSSNSATSSSSLSISSASSSSFAGPFIQANLVSEIRATPVRVPDNYLFDFFLFPWTVQWTPTPQYANISYFVQYSLDGGITWLDYGQETDALQTLVGVNVAPAGQFLDCLNEPSPQNCGFSFRICARTAQGILYSDLIKTVNLGDPCGASVADENCLLPEGCCGQWAINYDSLEWYCQYPDFAGKPECCVDGVCPGDAGSGGGTGDACGYCGEWKTVGANNKRLYCEDTCMFRADFTPIYQLPPKPEPTPVQMAFYNDMMASITESLQGKTAYTGVPPEGPGRLAYASPDVKIWSNYPQSFPTSAPTRNPNSWLAGFENISCLSAFQLSGFDYYKRPATLLTRKHALFCNHFAPGDDWQYVFVDDDNNAVTVRLRETRQVVGDLQIGVFEEEIPENIKIAKVLPKNFRDYIFYRSSSNTFDSTYHFGRLGIAITPMFDPNPRDYIINLKIMPDPGSWSNLFPSEIPNGDYFGTNDFFFALDGTTQFGISGSPVFTPIRNELAIIGAWHTPAGGPMVSEYYDAINATIEQLSPGEGYALTPINLQSVYEDLLARGVPTTLDERFKIPGCTNHWSPNFSRFATCDDGSCITCHNQEKCAVPDTDGIANCNSIGEPRFGFQQTGCCDASCVEFNDCAPTFNNSFTAIACDGSVIEYAACQPANPPDSCIDGELMCPEGICPCVNWICCPDGINCAPTLEDCPGGSLFVQTSETIKHVKLTERANND